MPEPYPILNSLVLEQTGESSYRGPSVPSEVRPVVFGGQLMGQMIVAATASLPGKTVRSLHAIFARAGTVTQPVDLEVDSTRLPAAEVAHVLVEFLRAHGAGTPP